MDAWVVHKFGGSSVANADCYRRVAGIIQDDPSSRKAVVVSAMAGVTNALIELVQLAQQQNENYRAKLGALKEKHLKTVAELFPAGNPELIAALDTDFSNLAELLRGIWLARTCPELTLELISGHGEVWSAQFLNGYLQTLALKSQWLDARKVLVVEPLPTSVSIQWESSQAKLNPWLQENSQSLLVITGFVACTPEGLATTLKRNGSDYSATIFGALLRAREITIWTDVDGVLSADPRLVTEAVVLDELSYQEAAELAYFGAKVVHPSTMGPAIKDGIPIKIRNTFNPIAAGTVIKNAGPSAHLIKGFATIDEMALVNVEGTGMIGVPGIAQRLFGALKEVGVSVVFISQASSEHSICFAMPQGQASITRGALEKAFFAELHHGQIQTINIKTNCSIIAIVGDNMHQMPGVAAKFFSALGKAGISIRAIAQGSSERNISAVIDRTEAVRALRTVHSSFYLSHQTLSIGVVGAGLIGGTLLDQLARQIERLRKDFRIDLRVRGILNSKGMLLGEPALNLNQWRETFKNGLQRPDWETFLKHIQPDQLPHSVIIDATSSNEMPQNYLSWFDKGIHLITPNKKGNSGTLRLYRELKAKAMARRRHYLYETTVGAGLPVINTLRDLVQTGDEIIGIEGVLSGTLSFLFNSFSARQRFSEIVVEAKQAGFTEPDPREDLSGLDVARKLVILAREMGLDLELHDIEIENLVPESQRQLSVEEWLSKLPELDSHFETLRADAASAGEVLRYVGTIRPKGKSSVQLKRYPLSHPFAGLSSSDNMVVFQSSRYDKQPLIVRGPGAGPEVTAAGVFADILRLMSYIGGDV